MSKKLMVLWGYVILGLVLVILLIGVRQKDFVYESVKNDIIDASKKYMNDNNIELSVNESFKIFINDLIDKNYLSDEHIEEYCLEEIIIYNGLFQDEYKLNQSCKKNEE